MFDPISLLIQLIVGVVLSIGSTLLKQAFAPKTADQQSRTGTRGSAQIGGKVPQYFLVGTVGEAGKLEYQNAWGNNGEVPNAYLTNVYSYGDLPISAMRGLYVNGVRVTLSATGAVAQGYPVPEYSGNLWWKFFDGAQTAADGYLLEKFGGDADRAWAIDMVGRGVPYLITTALWSETLWTGFPSFVGEFQGIKLYDPRKDSTVGGIGSQRWADPATWAFSDNSMVIIYNIERGIYYDGVRVWGGDATAAQLPYAPWAAAMDACDLPIGLVAGGTERQFRAGRRINLNERPADVIKELLIGANSRISHASDGTIYPLVGVPSVADGAFSDADVLGTEPLGSIPFPDLDSIINGATATYREPAQAWEDKETAPYLRSDLEAEDDGRQQIEGLDLGTTFSGTQAQRVIKAVIEEGRRFKTHVVALPPEFAQFRPLQVLAWTSARFDYAAKLFLITARTRSPWGQVVFGLQEIDPTDHNWTPGTDEQPLSFAPVVTNRPAPQEVSGFFVEPAIALDSEGNGRRPAVDVFWSAASVTVDVDFVRITHRLAGEIEPRWQGLIPRPQLATGSARVLEALLPDDDFEFQIEYVAGSGRQTVASNWLAVTTPNVRLGPLDVVYGDLDLNEIGEQAKGMLEWIGGNLRNLIDQAQAQATLTGDQELANAMQFDEMRRSLSTVAGDLSASFEETITTAIIPMNGQLVAMADALTQLSAADGDAVNTARWRMTATTGPGGSSVLGFEARFDPGNTDDFRTAGMFIITPNDPEDPTTIMFDAERFVLGDLTSGASVNPLVYDGGIWRVNDLLVGSASIQDLAVTRAKVGAAAIGSAEIDDLAVTRAKIGNLAVGTGQIDNLGVTTLKIGPNAVTVPAFAATSGDITLVPVTLSVNDFNVDPYFTNVQTVSITVAGGDVFIDCSFAVRPSSSGDWAFLTGRLLRGGTEVRRWNFLSSGVGNPYVSYSGAPPFSAPQAIPIADFGLGAGTYTYTLQVAAGRWIAGDNVIISNRQLRAFNRLK